MKMEYLESGSADCPLIRLYEFTTEDAKKLAHAFAQLAEGDAACIALHEQANIQCVGGCQLTLRLDSQDRGVAQIARPATCECRLTADGWQDVVERTMPFISQPSAGFQWLDETGDISLLLSFNGHW